MWPHIIQIDGKFVVKVWFVVEFSGMVIRPDRTYWWGKWLSDDWTRFDTPEQAREAYENRPRYKKPKHSKKFIGFI